MNALRLFLVLGLALGMGPIVRIQAQSKASDLLKRAGLLPDARAKPPIISKQEGDLARVGITAWQTDRGRQAPAPTPGKPVYYVAYDGGFDANIKGVKPPPSETMGRTLRAALASMGYEPATNENRPSLAIVYRTSYENRQTLPSPFTEAAASNSYGGGTPASSVCTFILSAYDFGDLERSTRTILWVTQCASTTTPPARNPEETYLALVTASAPHFGALLPDDVPREIEFAWMAIPRRDDLTDGTPAFSPWSFSVPVLDQSALRDMAQKEKDDERELTRDLIATGRGRPARGNVRNRAAPVEISPALARRIAMYLQEKNALKEIMAARTQGLAVGVATGPLLDAFAAEHASRISALTLTGEAIRRTIVRMGTPTAPADVKDKSLDALLREYEPQIRASTKPAPEAKTSDTLKPTGPLSEADFKPTDRNIRVNVVAEQTPTGRKRAPLTPDRPVYAAIYDGGFFNLPGALQIRETPSAVTVARSLHAALARRGVFPATDGKAASLVLAYHWGVTNRDSVLLFPAGTTAMPTSIYPSSPSSGGYVYGEYAPDLFYFYFVIVTAYDAAEIDRGVAVPLWRVKVSTTGSGTRTTLVEALPSLLAAGSDYFGRTFAKMEQFQAPVVTLDEDKLSAPPPPPAVSPAAQAAIDGILSWTRRVIDRRIDPKLDAAPFLDTSVTKEFSRSALPSALAERVSAYQREKAALQDALAAQIKSRSPGPAAREVVEVFNAQNAGRIAALERNRESIRSELARWAAADPAAKGDKSLDDLLREFAGDAQQRSSH